MASEQSSPRWWGDYEFREGEAACWHLGHLQLWVQRGTHAWQLAALQTTEETGVEFRRGCADDIPDDAPVQVRYAYREPGDRIVIEPRLPDRPLVWRPLHPLFVAPGEEINLYLSIPLWLGFRVGHRAEVLWEWPLRRLSDTWFGSPTEQGGYAYSADRDAVCDEPPVVDTRRAVMPILIRNAADTPLRLERLNLPVTYLSLFAGEAGVWTPRVILERDKEDEELALLRLGKGAPRESAAAVLVAGPRLEADNLVFQTFSRLFG